LDRGYRMVELLKQGQYQPMDVIDQILSIYAGTRGHLDKVPVTRVAEWERDFLAFVREQKSEIRKKIAETKDMDDATTQALEAAIRDFQTQFAGKTASKT
jgi:F-type H+-transporting ATPase subunit alpha